jgi:hypothetical protein
MASTGENYTQALTAPPGMERDRLPSEPVITMLAVEVMIAGKRAATSAPPGDLTAAVTAVRKVIAPMWPRFVPEGARDVLITCAQIAVDLGVTELPAGLDSITAADMLELTAEWVAAGSPAPRVKFTPPTAYASSSAFDRDEDAETFTAVCLLLAIAHPASPPPTGGPVPDDDQDDGDDGE